MKKKYLLLLLLFALAISTTSVWAQAKYSIVIKGGHVIDPKNNINTLMDIAVNDGKIVQVAKNIDPKLGIQVVDAKGLFVKGKTCSSICRHQS